MECIFDCEEFKRYHVDLPYPSVVVPAADPHAATLVSGAFAGKGSETTAITQYAAHRFYTCEYPEVYTAYKYIAAVEMTHFGLLGCLIKNLGLRPLIYSYETRRFWNGSHPAYRYTVKQILESDIEGEKAAVAHYTRLITQIGDESIQALFRRIILDEQRHIEVLTALYAACV